MWAEGWHGIANTTRMAEVETKSRSKRLKTSGGIGWAHSAGNSLRRREYSDRNRNEKPCNQKAQLTLYC